MFFCDGPDGGGDVATQRLYCWSIGMDGDMGRSYRIQITGQFGKTGRIHVNVGGYTPQSLYAQRLAAYDGDDVVARAEYAQGHYVMLPTFFRCLPCEINKSFSLVSG